MKEFIDIFKMEDISRTTRANIIVRLGTLINQKYSPNLHEEEHFLQGWRRCEARLLRGQQ